MDSYDFHNIFPELNRAEPSLKRKVAPESDSHYVKKQRNCKKPSSPFKIISRNLEDLEFPQPGDPIKITHESFQFWLGDLTRSGNPFWGQAFSFDSSPMLKRLTHIVEKQGKSRVKIIYDGRNPSKKDRYPAVSPIALRQSNALYHQKIYLSGDQGIISTGNLSTSAEDPNKQINLTLAFDNEHLTRILKENSEAILFNKKSAVECNQSLLVGDQEIELWYTPDSDHLVENRILELLDKAEPNDHLHIAIFTFTSWKVARKIIDLHNSGVNIHFHVDRSQTYRIPMQKSIIQALLKAGIPVRVNRKGTLHTKSIALKGKNTEFLVTGSLNYTKAGIERNYEIVTVIPKLNLSQSDQIAEYHRFLAQKTKPIKLSKLH